MNTCFIHILDGTTMDLHSKIKIMRLILGKTPKFFNSGFSKKINFCYNILKFFFHPPYPK
jgi:hypothetical protein